MERTIQQFSSLELQDTATQQAASGLISHVPRYSEADMCRMKIEFERIAKDQEQANRQVVDAHRSLKKEKDALLEELKHKTQVLEHTTRQLSAMASREEQNAREIQKLRQVNYALMVHLQQKSSDIDSTNGGSGPLSPRPPPDVF